MAATLTSEPNPLHNTAALDDVPAWLTIEIANVAKNVWNTSAPTTAVDARNSCRWYLRMTSRMAGGALRGSPARFFAASKTGDSATFSRTNSPTPTRTAENRNGTRQPQARNSSSGMELNAA